MLLVTLSVFCGYYLLSLVLPILQLARHRHNTPSACKKSIIENGQPSDCEQLPANAMGISFS